jgi:tight adherence protein B
MGAALGLVLAAGLLLLERAVRRRPVRSRAARSRRGSRWLSRRADLLRQAGFVRVHPVRLVVIELACGLALAVVVDGVTGAAGLAAAGFGLGAMVPSALLRRAARRRTADRRELWPEVVESLASGVRAGLSLPEALAAVGERGPQSLRPSFAAFGADHRASGRTAEALDRLRERLADPVADRVVETVRLAREVGGTDVGTVLRTLAGFLREDARTRAELEARQSWTVNAARVAVSAPWLVLLLLGSQPETARAYDTGIGTAVLAAGGFACVLAYRAMVRIGRLPVERRVLR